MGMKLIEIAGERFTQIKILKSKYGDFKRILNKYGIKSPTKENSRYIYFEVKGDLLNRRAEQ